MPGNVEIKVNLRNDDRVRAMLEHAPDILRDLLTATITEKTDELYQIVRGKASGGVINVVTGQLLSSLKPTVRVNKASIRGRVRSTGVPYFGVVNFGGRLQAREIEASNARALHFVANAGEVFAAVVNHPAYVVKKHEILYSSRDQIAGETREAISDAVDKATDLAQHGG